MARQIIEARPHEAGASPSIGFESAQRRPPELHSQRLVPVPSFSPSHWTLYSTPLVHIMTQVHSSAGVWSRPALFDLT